MPESCAKMAGPQPQLAALNGWRRESLDKTSQALETELTGGNPDVTRANSPHSIQFLLYPIIRKRRTLLIHHWPAERLLAHPSATAVISAKTRQQACNQPLHQIC